MGENIQAPAMAVSEVSMHVDRGERVYFVDCRNEDEWQGADTKLPGAYRADPVHPYRAADDLPGHSMIVTYCSCPNEESSRKVASALRSRGHTNVHVLKGGFDAWIDNGEEVEPRVVRPMV